METLEKIVCYKFNYPQSIMSLAPMFDLNLMGYLIVQNDNRVYIRHITEERPKKFDKGIINIEKDNEETILARFYGTLKLGNEN